MIVVFGISHHTAPVDVRERFAVSEAQLPEALMRLCGSGLAEEAVILSTCNRVEIYAVTNGARADLFKEFFGDSKPAEVYSYSEPASLEHLFKVASGMDSMVLGETEIFGQLKKAYEIARTHGRTGARLNRAFQRAFNVGKHIRSETKIQRGSVSVGSVAVELAEKIFATLDHRHVMVIGAGDTSEKTARALLSRGVKSIIVSNRSRERAEALATELGGRAVSFEDWAKEFSDVDIVISSTSAPHYVIDRARLQPLMRARKHRALLLIDIAVPRDIEPEVNFMEDVYLYNIDDLQAIADDYLKQRKEELARCEAIIREKARALLTVQEIPSAHPAFGHE